MKRKFRNRHRKVLGKVLLKVFTMEIIPGGFNTTFEIYTQCGKYKKVTNLEEDCRCWKVGTIIDYLLITTRNVWY